MEFGKSENQLLASCEKTFNETLDLLKKKNADYAGDANTYKNFEDPELQAYLDKHGCKLDAVELGIRIRLKDKWARVNTLLFSDKDPSVIGESLEDTFSDIIGYAGIIKAWRENKRNKAINDIIYKTTAPKIVEFLNPVNKWNDVCFCGHDRNYHAEGKKCIGNGLSNCYSNCGLFILDPRGKEL